MPTVTDFEPIAEGFHLEAMFPDGERLWFSDALEPGLRRLDRRGSVTTHLPDRAMIGGILLNYDGKVLCSGIGGIAWFDPETGRCGTLIDRIDRAPLPGVNEMIPDRRGGIYFGVLDIPALARREKMPPWGIYRLDRTMRTSLVAGGIVFPNGLALSPNGHWLYCNETHCATTAYKLLDGGAAAPPRRLRAMEDADGLAVDASGSIWSVGYATGEIARLDPGGAVIEFTPAPAAGITNICFGGDDLRDLYITAACPETIAQFQRGEVPSTRGSRIYRARCAVPGLAIGAPRFDLAALDSDT